MAVSVSNFIIQALQNKDITIYGDGNQTRSFQYVDDLIEGMIRMMNTSDRFYRPGKYRKSGRVLDERVGQDRDPFDKLLL